jgi:Ca2+-binding RTX toxin-like protein
MAINKFGTSKADSLKATANDQALYGGADTTGGSSGYDTLDSGRFTGISLYGGDGNDILIAKSSDKLIDGGDDTDTVQFADSVGFHDDDSWLLNVQNIVITRKSKGSYDFSDQSEGLNITGGSGDDTIYGGTTTSTSTSNDTIRGGAGNDVLHVAQDDDLIDGGAGTDTAVFSAGVNSTNLSNIELVNVEKIVIASDARYTYDFSGQTEALDITASGNGDNITGGSGADTIRGGSEADTLDGGAGNDVFYATDKDSLEGGAGTNTVYFSDNVSADELANGSLVDIQNIVIAKRSAGSYDFSVQGETLNVTGSGSSDSITGGDDADTINGLAGHDVLNGYYGADVLNGGDGNDTLEGGGNDTSGSTVIGDKLFGGAGNDTLVAEDLDALIDGGAGVDTARFDLAVIATNLSDKDLVNVEIIEVTNGSAGSYDFSAQSESLTIKGGDADDIITGGKGVDKLYGGDGDDTLVAQDTDALIDGGAGDDTVEFKAAVMARNLSDGDLVGVEYIDITNKGNARYDFSQQSESLEIAGDSGKDVIIGGRNADVIEGDDGDDSLLGGAGNDTLAGNKGNDTLTGGAGSDVFEFEADLLDNGVDTITDFVSGRDRLDLSLFAAGGSTSGSVLDVMGTITTANQTVYVLSGQASGAADHLEASAAALRAAVDTWKTDAAATACVIVSDNNSAAIYRFVDVAASADGVDESELTLVGIISGTVVGSDVII